MVYADIFLICAYLQQYYISVMFSRMLVHRELHYWNVQRDTDVHYDESGGSETCVFEPLSRDHETYIYIQICFQCLL